MEQSQTISSPQSRIHVLDALRGFALLGVILMHMLQHFGVFSDMLPPEPRFPMLDTAIQWLSQHVIMGKFINIFAFLFGLSFFIQMDRGAKKGIDFRKRFIWRMVVLFAIGIVGNSFFTADILTIYAAFGVIMVLLFPLKNWVLIVIAVLLLIGTPRIISTSYDRLVKTEQTTNMSQRAVSSETGRNRAVSSRETEEKPSFFKSAERNLTTGFIRKLNYQFGLNGRGYITMALFILGLVVGRLRFFEGIETHKKRNILLFVGFTLVCVLISLIPLQEVTFRMLMSGEGLSTVMLLSMALNDIHTVFFSGTLALGFIILYQTNSVRMYLNVIIPYGRMGLTNYVTQSIAGGILFSMWGLGAIFGSWGTTEVFVLGLVVYIIQAILSTFWLKYYLYGPLEWFWRSATYFKVQPFRKKQ
ncbi:DUF418 domain-containing protein [Parabacteroides sp. AM08-6]|uniref:DUF418 domain-containing protein n=1 Tax=Parabacteroides sp. AM08-6 TaxID=2292053 RepID=UPI000EFFC1B7|nr:DUF418 domain-containing protein [Parabacteroides sp. AM08-6]RHJ82685.1 DUF418 domain-containing protein [Parabacteroides sp. AM08-6]